eukprot:1158261-Pelagomonas_calceolata.AAC.4
MHNSGSMLQTYVCVVAHHSGEQREVALTRAITQGEIWAPTRRSECDKHSSECMDSVDKALMGACFKHVTCTSKCETTAGAPLLVCLCHKQSKRHAPEAYVCSCKNMLKRTASCFFGIILSAWAKHSKGLAPRMERSLHRGASPARCARP